MNEGVVRTDFETNAMFPKQSGKKLSGGQQDKQDKK